MSSPAPPCGDVRVSWRTLDFGHPGLPSDLQLEHLGWTDVETRDSPALLTSPLAVKLDSLTLRLNQSQKIYSYIAFHELLK